MIQMSTRLSQLYTLDTRIDLQKKNEHKPQCCAGLQHGVIHFDFGDVVNISSFADLILVGVAELLPVQIAVGAADHGQIVQIVQRLRELLVVDQFLEAIRILRLEFSNTLKRFLGSRVEMGGGAGRVDFTDRVVVAVGVLVGGDSQAGRVRGGCDRVHSGCGIGRRRAETQITVVALELMLIAPQIENALRGLLRFAYLAKLELQLRIVYDRCVGAFIS